MMPAAYERTRELFKGFDYQVVVRAVIDKTSPGKIWVNDVKTPESGFMSTTEGWFLAGNPKNNKFNQGLRELVHEMILKGNYYSPVNPEFLSELFFHIDSEKWISEFNYIFDIRPPLPSRRIHFTCSKVTLDWKNKLSKDYTLLPVNPMLDMKRLEIPEDIRQWIGNSLENQKKRGFGKCLVHGKKVVVWISADCSGDDECEIGIITTKDYRKKGLGLLTAAVAVDDCLSNGYSLVGWHCDYGNEGSIRVARKVGFRKERDYVHYICMFSEAEHFAESGLRHFYKHEFVNAVSDFENAFQIGEVQNWAYVVAGRSYLNLDDVKNASAHFIKAKTMGWSDWDWLFQDEEIQSKFVPKEWEKLISKLKQTY